MTDRQVADRAAEGFAYGRIWLIGAGFLGVQVAFTLYNAFLLLPSREFFGSTAAIGLLMGTDNLVGLLLIPVVGAWSARINPRLGRRLPFMLVAVPIAALSFAGIPYAADVLWTLIVVEIVFTAVMHSYRGPVISLMPDHVPPERRSTGNGIINLMGGAGVLTAFGGPSLLYDIDPRLPFEIGAVILLVTLGVVYVSAERHPPDVDDQVNAGPRPIGDAIAGFRDGSGRQPGHVLGGRGGVRRRVRPAARGTEGARCRARRPRAPADRRPGERRFRRLSVRLAIPSAAGP